MKVIVDKEADVLLKSFLDLALKVGGLQNLAMVQAILNCKKVEEKIKEKEKEIIDKSV